ncbi:putative reverse transcriptase domain-containing protein [Tanacetum coccineum]
MSDSEDFTVTYTEVSSPFEGLSDIGSPGVVGPEYEGLPWMLDDPYVQDEVFPTEEQPLPAALSPTTDSPGYVPEFDSEEDLEEDPEEDLADYHADGGDDGDDEDDSSDDDEDDDVDIEEEEEEHPAPADSTAVAFPMSIRDEPPTPFWSEAEIARLLAIPSPPPSPLSLWLSPLPQIPSPPLPVSPPSPVAPPPLPVSPTYPLGYRVAMIRLRAEASSTSHPLPLPSPIILPCTRASVAMMRVVAPSTYILAPRSEAPPSRTPPLLLIPLPTPSPPLLLPSIDRRADVREACLPPRKRLCFAFERDVGYGITDTWDEMLMGMLGAPAADETELGRWVTDLVMTMRQDTDEIYRRLGDAQTEQQMETSWVNMLVRDRRAHAHTARLMKIEARMSREAWGRSMDVSDLACTEVMALRTQKMAPKRATRSTPAATTTTTSVTNAKLQAMIHQGVISALAARDAIRSMNCEDSHIQERVLEAMGNALTWWNSHVKTVGNDVAYAMTWTELKKKMTDKYYLRTEIKKLEVELWDLKIERMFPKESDKIERYIGGLPDMTHESVVASKPKIMQEATEIETELMDKRIRTFVDRQTENKRKQDNNQQQQPQNKRQNIGRAYAAGVGEKKLYGGSKPLCPKCNYHHDGPCAPKCHKCNRVGHLARDCRSPANANTANNQRGIGTGQKPTCYECGAQGHFKRECPKLKNNNNRGNLAGNVYALAKVYAVGHAGTNPDFNVVMGTFLLNNRYASIFFDTSADGSFVSTAFSSQIDITPTALDRYYDIKLANGRIIRLNTILRGCTLNILNHPFNIDLMPIELGSFDVIIGMDWLVKYQAIIVRAEKIVRIPWGNETLIVHRDRSNWGNEARLHIISYTKTQEYMLKGCPVFLENVTTKETEDKSEKKQLEDVPIVRDFPDVFPKDLSGLPLTRQVEFQIDLIPGAAPVARAPYRLAPSKIKDLSEQLKELSDKGFIRPSSSPWGAPVLFVKKKD